MATPKRSAPAAKGGRATLLWVGSLMLAAAATATLVVGEDIRIVRLGLLAALWSALLGAFGVARLRHRMTDEDERVAEIERIYQRELEREIAARREHEFDIENQAHRNAAEEVVNEIRVLRAELRSLRSMVELPAGSGHRDQGHPPVGKSVHPGYPNQNGAVDSYGSVDGRPVDRNGTNVNHVAAAAEQEASSQDRDAIDGPAVNGWTSQVAAGAHAEGTSVTDLLATYGEVEDSRRRSRRTG